MLSYMTFYHGTFLSLLEFDSPWSLVFYSKEYCILFINILLNFSFCVLQKIESQMDLEWHELTMTEFYF